MLFLGRENELGRLASFYRSDEQAVALVHGRRRVGKSELIARSIESVDCPAVYYECKQTSEQNNAASLGGMVAEALGYPPLAFNGIEEVLSLLFNRADESPLILVLDEYPYLRDVTPGIDSILQSLIDAHRHTSRMKLVLCGSYLDVMKSLMAEQNPLFGRVDVQIDLKPMDYYDSALFYPTFSDEDKVRLYSVFGGIPYYNRLIDAGKTVRENIIALIASPNARLVNEVPQHLRGEMSKLVNANEVFEALAAGHTKFNDILQQSHVSSSPALADTLDKLMRMELVEKRAPINDPGNRKKATYRIADNMALFFYRFIFNRQSQMQVMDEERFFDRFIAQEFEEHYVPHRFEDVCAQYLVRLNRAGRAPIPFEVIGSYYYDAPEERRNGEFDIVTGGEDGYTFYEAKFRAKPVSRAMVREEIDQVRKTGLDCRVYGFFSRSGFEEPIESGIVAIGLDELYR